MTARALFKEVSLTVSRKDQDLINHCILRAQKIPCFRYYDFLALSMDLAAVKAQGVPIDFNRLLNFNDIDFVHDIDGIRTHLNRENGLLMDLFIPRSARNPPVLP